MPIVDIAAEQTPTTPPGPTCTVCQKLAELPDPEANALRALMANPAWRYQVLAERLRSEGVDLSAGSLSRHARGRCLAREKLRGA